VRPSDEVSGRLEHSASKCSRPRLFSASPLLLLREHVEMVFACV